MNEEEIKKIEKACEKAVEYLKVNKMPYASLIIKEDGIKVVQDQAFIPSNTKQSQRICDVYLTVIVRTPKSWNS